MTALPPSFAERATFAVAATPLLLLTLLPLGSLGADLLDVTGQGLAAFFGSWPAWRLLLVTLGLSTAVTAGALALGIPVGLLVAQTDAPGRRAAFALHALCALLPPFLLAFGWFHVFGTQGWLGSPATSRWLFSALGVVATLSLGFSPIACALTALATRRIDPALVHAARSVGSPAVVVAQIVVPLAWPAIALAALIVFALATSEVGVPMFLRVRTYPAAVLTRLAGFDYQPGEAAALSLPLIAMGGLLLWTERRLSARAAFHLWGASHREPHFALGRFRWLAGGALWAFVLLTLVPVLAHAAAAGPEGFLRAQRWLGSSVGTSLASSAVSATLLVALGLVLGHALAAGRRPARALDGISVAAFLAPSAVLGAGLIGAFNRAQTHSLYTGLGILVVGLCARYAALAVRAVAAVFGSSSPRYERAAAAAGAGYLRRLGALLVPMHARSLASVWLLVFALCARDLDAVISVRPAGLTPLPVRIFTLEANGPPEVVAALSCLQVVVTGGTLAAFAVLLGAGGRRR